MIFKNRGEIRDFIVEIEKKFPVDDWHIDNIHIWPYLRIKLFFELVDNLYCQGLKKPVNFESQKYPLNKKKISFNLVKNIFRGKIRAISGILNYIIFINTLGKFKNVFFTSRPYCSLLDGAFYERFIDPILEKSQPYLNQSKIFDYSSNPHFDYFSQENRINIYKHYIGFLSLYENLYSNKLSLKELNVPQYEDFISFLKIRETGDEFVENWRLDKLNRLNSIKVKSIFLKRIFQKAGVEKVINLCYYNSDFTFAALYACNDLKLKGIDLQHGSIANEHLGYGSWTKIPKNGFNTIPKEFWCWDIRSSNVIKKWSQFNKSYSVLTFGHPWVAYWQNKFEIPFERKNILFTMQPHPMTLEMSFPFPLIHLMKQSQWTWNIRLHPRQIESLQEVKDFFIHHNLKKKVFFSMAAVEPLPVVLQNCLIHVTHGSGCTQEAFFLGKFTILLSSMGNIYFKNLIDIKKAQYLPVEHDNFREKFNEIVLSELSRRRDVRSAGNLREMQEYLA